MIYKHTLTHGTRTYRNLTKIEEVRFVMNLLQVSSKGGLVGLSSRTVFL